MGIPANHPAIQDAIRKGLIPPAGGDPPSPTRSSKKTTRRGDGGRVTVRLWVAGLLPASEANMGGGLPAKLARKKAVKAAVGGVLAAVAPPRWVGPVTVRFVRVGGQKCDGDNLSRCYKAVRDAVAKWLAADDGDTSRVVFRYAQRPNGFRGVVKYAPGTEIDISGEVAG